MCKITMSDEILNSSKSSKCGDHDPPKIHPKSPKTPPPPRTPPTPPNINKPLLLSDEQKSNLSKDALFDYICDIENYVGALESQTSNQEGEILMLRSNIERLKHQNTECSVKEKIVQRRLATKEQEIHDYASQLSELKTSQVGGSGMLRSVLLDPAVNLLIQRLKHELTTTKTRLEETQNELNAWKFTPDSNTGKRLMAKCRLLYQENEELGKMISSGRLAKLEGDLALQKSFSEEVKKSQSELDEILQDLDEDVEGMQTTILYLQQELRKSKQTIASLEKQLASTDNNHVNGNDSQHDKNDSDRTLSDSVSEGRTNSDGRNNSDGRTNIDGRVNSDGRVNKRTAGDVNSLPSKRTRSDSVEFEMTYSDPEETLTALTNGK
ncbi:hypothetical protein M8J77_015880 [Diaphorina citri]|nr:hypothetical protein M8J77_015880 [Diaphorina citri]